MKLRLTFPTIRKLSLPIYCLVFTISFLFPCFLNGQIVVATGLGTPKDTVRENWYHDTLNQVIWNKQHNAWQVLEVVGRIKDKGMVVCHKNLIFKSESGDWVYNLSGKKIALGEYCQCFGQVVSIFEDGRYRYIHDSKTLAWGRAIFADGDRISATKSLPLSPLIGLDSSQGIVAFCATTPNMLVRDDRFVYWGMLDNKGEWLIKPKFDAPFNFKNGVAVVLYEGYRRTINEKGEFLE